MTKHSPAWRLVRRSIIALGLLLASCEGDQTATSFAVEEATIREIHLAYVHRQLSAEALTRQYLARIEAHDQGEGGLHTIRTLQSDALARAQSLDQAFARQHALVGALHGIPILVEESLAVADTADAEGTTVDALAVSRLREAGAIILGTTAAIAALDDDEPAGRNPYDPARLSLSPGVSAVAANLAVAAVGADSQGSLVGPAAANGVVSIRPSSGLVSSAGVTGADETTAVGPVARTVEDAAVVLEVMSGALVGLAQRRSGPLGATAPRDMLQATALDGARIAMVRELVDAASFAGGSSALSQAARKLFIKGLGVMRAAGAHVSGLSVADIDRELTPLLTSPEDAEHGRMLLRERLLTLLDRHRLDGLAYLSIGATDPPGEDELVHGAAGQLSALSGLPSVTVPLGTSGGLPLGLTMLARPFQERQLLSLAFSFEQATHYREPPPLD